MERKRKNEANREESLDEDRGADGKPIEEEIQPSESSTLNPIFRKTLNRIWFYPLSATDQLPGSTPGVPGLSIRYLYTDLRIQSGVTTTDIASELEIHSSRLTTVRQELSDLFPMVSPKTWLPLGDFLPLVFSPEIMQRMDLIGLHSRFSLVRRPLDLQMQQRILFFKTILLEAYALARSFRYPDHDTMTQEPELQPDISEFRRRWSLVTEISEKRCLVLDITQK